MHRRLPLLILLCLMASPTAVRAQADHPLQPELQIQTLVDPFADATTDELLAALDDPEFVVREQAHTHLLQDDALDPPALRKLLLKAQSDEQRHRLIAIAEHHVMRIMREKEFGEAANPDADGGEGADAPQQKARVSSASVGFSYKAIMPQNNPHADLAGVVVTATMPGFPGHAYLQLGDTIVAINGQTPLEQNHPDLITRWLGWQIAMYKPGDATQFTVMREGKLIKFKVPFAQSTALNQMYTLNAFNGSFRARRFNDAWLKARAELTRGLPEPSPLVPEKK